MTISDPVRRAIRTGVQAFITAIIVNGGLSATATTGIVDWSALHKMGVSALFAAVAAVLSYAQNALEDNVAAVPAILKSPPSPGINPVPDGD